MLRQDLDRDLAPGPSVPRAIQIAHAAGAERRDDLVGAKVGSKTQRHPQTLPHLGLVPEAGLEPALPCGKGILREREKGNRSRFS